MKDRVKKLDAFLQFSEEAVLQYGQVSHEASKALVEQEYDKFYASNFRITNLTLINF